MIVSLKNYTLNLPDPQSSETHTLATQEWVQANTLSDLNLEIKEKQLEG